MMLLGILIALLTAVCIHKTVLISHGAPVIRVAHGSDTRIDGLIIGCCVGVLASSGMVSRIARWVSASLGPLLLVFVTYMMGIIAPYGFGLTIVNLFFAALLIVLLATGPTTSVLAGFLSARPLLWLGKLSYSLYLWHIIARLAARSLFKDAGLVFLCSITLALLMAAISYYLIERPFLKLKKRFHEPMKTISTD
jgi:peptidoglycan/LPS O-acetylase OafA/YrhL